MAGLQRLVAYERVSTARQGASGLGLEAQRKLIEDFAASQGAESLRRAGKGGAALRVAVSANAAAFAADLAPVLADIQAAGHTSLRAIAAELTSRGIRTRLGGKWGVGNTQALLRTAC
jgi:hypothetical protein